MVLMTNESFLNIYLDEVRRVRALNAGTGETSFYPALGTLLNAVGHQLRPRLFCLHHPSGSAGIPDFGLFEQAQFRRDETPAWVATVTPERGVVEAKGASHGIEALLKSNQVREQYLPTYGLVLATNLWQFRLLDARRRGRELRPCAERGGVLGAGRRVASRCLAGPLRRFPATLPADPRPARPAIRRGVFPGVLCAGGFGAACRAGEASGAEWVAQGHGGRARHPLRRTRRGAAVPLNLGADPVLWRVLGLGDACPRRAAGLRLAVLVLVPACFGHEPAVPKGGDAAGAAAARLGAVAGRGRPRP